VPAFLACLNGSRMENVDDDVKASGDRGDWNCYGYTK
jgi:hypothetical protein